jgi:6-phosphogluconolactonase
MGHFPDARSLQTVEIRPDAKHLARAAAEQFVTLAGEAIANRGRFTVALAGGSTPVAAYLVLATGPFATRVAWSHVHVFWGDERCVPPGHADSNYCVARQALLDHVPLPASNVHRMRGELEPGRAAADYEQTLRGFFSSPARGGETVDKVRGPSFDLILLGMGDDGHTASLFPGTGVIHEQSRWVVAHYVEKLGAWRITLTPVVINAAAKVTFLVSGPGKAERLRQVLEGPYQPEVLPAQIVSPDTGRLSWLLDRAAASMLQDSPQRGIL